MLNLWAKTDGGLKYPFVLPATKGSPLNKGYSFFGRLSSLLTINIVDHNSEYKSGGPKFVTSGTIRTDSCNPHACALYTQAFLLQTNDNKI